MGGKSLHQQLLDGFDVKSRDDGTVHTIKREGKTVAEVCVGAKKVRLNVRESVKAPKNLELSGKSKTWAGGGCIVTEENLAACRALLASITEPTAGDAAAANAAASKEKQTTQKRVTRSSRTKVSA